VQCEEWNRLLREYDEAVEALDQYAECRNSVAQSFTDVLHAEQLQRTLHQKSVALQQHEKIHGCRVKETKK